MLRTKRLVVCLFFCIILVAPVLNAEDFKRVKPEKVGMSSERLERIGALMQRTIDDGRIAGTACMVLRHGKIAYLETHGMMDREKGIPMSEDAIFRICSMTKPITSVAVMMLYEEGHFLLTDPVSKYIPEFKNPKILKKTENGETYTVPASNEITILHLLTHTSGLTYHWNADLGPLYKEKNIGHGVKKEALTLEESVRRLAEVPLLFNPGERFEYGLNVDVLGRLVEVVSGESLDEFFRKHIFEPLDMKDTGFFFYGEKVNRIPSAYTWYKDKGLNRFPDEPIIEGSFSYDADYSYNGKKQHFSGGGGLCSTARDYARFAQMLLNGGELDGVRLLSPKTVEFMSSGQVATWLSNPDMQFGLGVAVWGEKAPLKELTSPGSYGWSGFYNTLFFIDPEEDMIGIFMSQLHPTGGLRLSSQFEVTVYQAIIE